MFKSLKKKKTYKEWKNRFVRVLNKHATLKSKAFRGQIVTLVVLKLCIEGLNFSVTRFYRLLLMNGIIWTLLSLIRPEEVVYTEFMTYLELD